MIDVKKFISAAQSQVGVKEVGGNNKGAEIVKYQQSTWLLPAAWAWCSAFVCWCMKEAIETTSKTSEWRCRDASAFGWIAWAKKHGVYITDEKELAKAGDIVVFDFSHVGIVEKDQIDTNFIETIEGNTNGKGERDSEAGDGVWRKKRHKTIVRAYIRLSNIQKSL